MQPLRSSPRKVARLVPAPALVVLSVLGIQADQAWGKTLFDVLSPWGVSTLRLGIAAIVLLAVYRHHLPIDARSVVLLIAFGTAIAGMSMFIYPALARLPVGIAVALQFLGPLSVALAGSRRIADGGWALLAGLGVSLFITTNSTAFSFTGAGFALASGASWAAYILLNRRAGARSRGGQPLALAVTWAALISVPFGVAADGATLIEPRALLAGTGIAIVSAVIPYSLDLAALRRITPRPFGVLGSLEPAAGALAGLLIVHEQLELAEWLAIACIVTASACASNTPTQNPGKRRRESSEPAK